MIAWVQDGYNESAPATTHGVLVLLAMSLGVLLSVHRPELASDLGWWLVGAAGLVTLYAKDSVRACFLPFLHFGCSTELLISQPVLRSGAASLEV